MSIPLRFVFYFAVKPEKFHDDIDLAWDFQCVQNPRTSERSAHNRTTRYSQRERPAVAVWTGV